VVLRFCNSREDFQSQPVKVFAGSACDQTKGSEFAILQV